MDTINVDKRDLGLSSKDLRLARKKNRIPAAIYGKDVSTLPIFLKAPAAQLQKLKIGKHFKVKVDGETYKATVEEVQKDPVSHAPLHIGLHAVSSDHVMKVEVPIVITGEAVGLKRDGIVTQVKRYISLKGKFKDLPEEIKVDISDLDVNEHLEVKDIELPRNVELLEDNLEQNVVACSYSNVSVEPDMEEGETEELETKIPASLKGPDTQGPAEAQV